MSVDTRIEAVGLKDALRELNSLDKTARRQITKDFKEVLAPVVDYGRSLIPDEVSVPSGMMRKWQPKRYQIFPYQQNVLKFDSSVSGKKPKQYGDYTKNLAVLSVYLKGAGDVVVDLAGVGKTMTEKGKAMAAALNSKLGRTPSRITWRAYDARDADVNRGLQEVMNKVMDEINRAKAFWKSKGYSR